MFTVYWTGVTEEPRIKEVRGRTNETSSVHIEVRRGGPFWFEQPRNPTNVDYGILRKEGL